MGIFYNPPLPPTANNAGTPPEPHVPIGNQGTSVPPRRAIAFAATMAILVSSWPADLEPRLQRPNDQQTKIAPLTLRYGSQPPQIPALAIQELTPIVASWQETWSAQLAPKSLAWLSPISPYTARTRLPSSIWTAWEPAPLPPPRPVAIAPLTLTYGTQPTPQPPLSTVELAQIVTIWAQTWDTQTAPKSAAWNVPPVVQAFVPSTRPRYDILALNQDPLTIVLVQSFVVSQSSTDEPPRQFALSMANQAIAQQAWAPAVAPPMARPSAAWNVPVISAFVPHTALPALIWNAWADPFVRPPAPVAIAPLTLAPPIITSVPFVAPSYAIVRAWQDDPSRLQRLVTIAPLTLVYGQQPPVQPPLSAASRLIILQAWPADLEPRLQRPNDQQNKIAPLTLTYGTRPPVRAPLSIASRIIIAAWPADLEPRLTRPNADRAGGPTWLNIPPLWTFGPLVEIHDVSVVVNSGLSNVSARAASLSDVSGEGA